MKRHVGLLLLVLMLTRSAGANGLDAVRGSASVGYAKLFLSDSPGGSLSASGGLDYPLRPGLRAGLAIGFHLLGTRSVQRGSLFANVDYSLFEVDLLAHWIPSRLGPVGRVSFGPAVMSARAELSTSGGGAGLSDLAVERSAAGAALEVTLISRSESPVRVGLEVGGRTAFLPGQDWTLASARLAFHY